MTSNQQDVQQRLKNLEAELNSSAPPRPSGNFNGLNSASPGQLWQWFTHLSGGGKAIVATIGAVVALAFISIVFQLISLAIRLGLLGLFLVVAYKFFVKSPETPA